VLRIGLANPLEVLALLLAFFVAAVEQIRGHIEPAANFQNHLMGQLGRLGTGIAGGTDHPGTDFRCDDIFLIRIGLHMRPGRAGPNQKGPSCERAQKPSPHLVPPPSDRPSTTAESGPRGGESSTRRGRSPVGSDQSSGQWVPRAWRWRSVMA